jgi:protein-L-isoaspartate(D-aspartate) O-methyltransferase
MDSTQRLAELGRRLRFDEEGPTRPEADAEYRALARACRQELVASIDHQLGPFDPLLLRAMLDVPRERFVREGDQDRSAEDIPLPLDDLGLATISAPHAYLLSFRLAELTRGDRLVELGSGSGYGAALASYIVGDLGDVITIEIDQDLFERTHSLLAEAGNVTVVRADAIRSTHLWGGARKIICTFAVDRIPSDWIAALPDGGVLVAPVGSRDRDQQLTRIVRRGERIEITEHGGVRYVKNRSPQ